MFMKKGHNNGTTSLRKRFLEALAEDFRDEEFRECGEEYRKVLKERLENGTLF